MFHELGALELVTPGSLAVLVFGPDKLPKVISGRAGVIRKVPAFSDGAKREIREELGPEFKDIEFGDLNPGTFIRKQVAGDALGLREIRSSFDLRKEMADGTDAVNGPESEPSKKPAPPAGHDRPASGADAA